jgi:RimJ/RimL family protein N-acetyltransferase
MIILETERMVLRHPELGDLDSLFALYRDPEMRRFFPDGALTYEETREELEWYVAGHPEHPELGLWSTVLKESGDHIGRCGLLPWDIDGRFEVEVAYMISKVYWGQGLGTEAASAIRDYGFRELGLSRLICLITEGNMASVRVAEKMGMTFEKQGIDDLGPYLLYAIERPSWGTLARDT